MIRYDVGEDSVARLVLDRPEAKNALTVEMRDEIVTRVREVRADREVRALLITGVGDAFCAGMDLRQSTVAGSGGAEFNPRDTSEALRNGVQAFIRELWELDKPTVAAVNGTAVGPGAHLALACDFVLVCEQTRFVWSFARWGLVVDAGGAYLLPASGRTAPGQGHGHAGRGGQGAEAVTLGLAYRCLPSVEELERGGRRAGGTVGGRAGPVDGAVQAAAQCHVRDRPPRLARSGGAGPGHGGGVGGDGRRDGSLRREAEPGLPLRPLTPVSPAGAPSTTHGIRHG